MSGPKRPQGWDERFEASLDVHPSPALEEWRWSREGEGKVDGRAVAAAWDLVSLQASAEAAKMHALLQQLDNELARTLLPALIVAGARLTEVGTLQVLDRDGKRYVPRDLSFVPGREHLPPSMTIRFGVEIGRNVADFLIDYRHEEHVARDGDLRTFEARRSMVLILEAGEVGRRARTERRRRDMELQQEEHLVVHIERSELWQDALGTASVALRTLVESARFEAEQAIASAE